MSKGVSLFSMVVDGPVAGLPSLEELMRFVSLPLVLLTPLSALPLTLRTSRRLSGEPLTIGGGREGLLKFSCVLCVGSAGPGLGVVSESSESSPDGGTEECVSEEGAE